MLYVALSRGRESNELVLVAAPTATDVETSHWDDEASPRRALSDCLRAMQRGAAKRLSCDEADGEETPAEVTVPSEQLDALVSAWRRSLTGAGERDQAPTALAPPAGPATGTTDSHLLAIEALLAAPRCDLLDAVARYREQLRSLHAQKTRQTV